MAEMSGFDRDAMLEMYTFEMSQYLEQLEHSIINGESGYTMDIINEIFRIMHTIKGSSAMMMFNNISTAAHAIEDLFYYMREENPQNVDASQITDHVLESLDFIKDEVSKIENGLPADGDCEETVRRIKGYLEEIKLENSIDGKTAKSPVEPTDPDSSNKEVNGNNDNNDDKEVTENNDNNEYKMNNADGIHYRAVIKFDTGCEMENVRAFALIKNLEGLATNIQHVPEDIVDESSIEFIRQNGFELSFFSDKDIDELETHLADTIYLESLELKKIELIGPGGEKVDISKESSDSPESAVNSDSQDVADLSKTSNENKPVKASDALNPTNISVTDSGASESVIPTSEQSDQKPSAPSSPDSRANAAQSAKKQSGGVISVNVSKLDDLLKLMGELVISEAMVTQNPELESLGLDSFFKEARQLRKIIKDIQDTVMSMRMVPLATTFFKMHRVVRDMCKQLGKDVKLVVIGEDTEVDKNIIEHISDPLMHIIRNSVDHGIETPEMRTSLGKGPQGVLQLEAKNSGSDVLIIIKDDGAGLNREKILNKAKAGGLLKKPDNEYVDREIFQFIFMPGFSTKENVTSYSGRGVGMDVVSKNLELVGGSVIVESVPGQGSTFTLKIPLTLAIIEGMTIKMSNARYTLPIISIQDSFKPNMKDIIRDPNGNEMICVRGECYNIIKLYDFFNIDSKVKNYEDGIMIMVENSNSSVCILVDEIVGEQQVVVKSMPKYIGRIKGISGCTLLGNGDISLIIDVAGFFD